MPRLATSPRHSDKSTARSVLARPVARARLKFVDSTPNLVDECLICYESTARRIPCCTARVCQRCAKGLSKCPICRVAILDEDIELCFKVASEGELRTRIREAVHLSALALICLRGRSPQEIEFFQDLLLYKALRIIQTLPLESFAFESERLVELIEQHNFDRNLVSEEIEDRLLHLVETSDKAKWAAAVVRLQSLALVNLSEILAMDEIRVARTRFWDALRKQTAGRYATNARANLARCVGTLISCRFNLAWHVCAVCKLICLHNITTGEGDRRKAVLELL
eukprot:GEMP01060975.1.p1 GENE.GEMP01060975.1~~GEMP01060975.1.p1  ORF type:complete len:292 (+),score=38.05 GEMP01060975.1:31-876(+)